MTVQPRQRQKMAVAPSQIRGLFLLEKSLPDLRAEIVAEMADNPVIEDIGHSLEENLSDVIRKDERDGLRNEPDYLTDDFVPGKNADEDVAERRQAFFDRQVKDETLQEHLLAQLPLSDIPQSDWGLVELLVGDLNDNGFYTGSLPDVCMTFGKTTAEVEAILAQIRMLDPPGCGSRTARECLLAQMDALEGTPHEETVRRLVEDHLESLGRGDLASVRAALKISEADLAAALAALRTLNPRPGSDYQGEHDRIEYVNPEVHAVCRDGYWYAETDERSLPEIRISKKYEKMLADPNLKEDEKAYIAERIASANALREAIARRQQTVKSIAQMAFDRQQAFFTEGFAALVTLTETEVAKAAGVDVATVSRTVRDKYAETPFGVIALRRLFVSGGVRTVAGVEISQEAVMAALRELIASEDPAEPLSDAALSARLGERGYPTARRTVAKYRDRLGFPGAPARRQKE